MQETWVWSLGRKFPCRRKWQPTPVFLPGESRGWRSLVGYSSRGRKESDTTERLHFTSLHVWMWELDQKEDWMPKNWFFWTLVLEKILESPLDSKEINAVNPKGNQSLICIGRTDAEAEVPTLAMWCKGLDHWKRPWCWERLKVGGEGDDRRWDGWMASPTQWTWVWVNSGSWWWTGRPGVLRSMGLQRVGHDWVTELNWIDAL